MFDFDTQIGAAGFKLVVVDASGTRTFDSIEALANL